MSEKHPIRLKAEELLSDGEWHSFDTIVNQLIPMIPPGQATRRNESRRRNAGGLVRPRSKPVRQYPYPLELQIRAGARSIIADMLRNHVFEIEGKGKPGRKMGVDHRRIRLRPPPGRPPPAMASASERES